MIDQRENILSRLVAVCAGVEGIVTAVRNRLDVAKLQRPAIVVLDGSEQLFDAPSTVLHSEIQRMELSPLIAVHIRGTDIADGGGLLSLYRSRLLSAILSDSALSSYVGTNGRIRYEGASVASPTAEGSEFRIDLMIVFRYPFRLDDIST
jgi:hypothetical protein